MQAHRVLQDAFKTDVRELLAEWRESQGIDPDPISVHRRSGYQAKVAQERGTVAGGGGYPVKERVPT